jgi:hypothetical protein
MARQITASQTPEQLRHDIDSGRTGDKVPASDPAAAPLGTDEEAAGTPVSPARVAMARASETSRPSEMPRRREVGSAWILIGAIGLFAALAIGWGWSVQ